MKFDHTELIKTLDDYLMEQKQGENIKEISPNGWGWQEYGDRLRVFQKDNQIDYINQNKDDRYSYIKQFIMKHIEGIDPKNSTEGISNRDGNNLFKLGEHKKSD